MKTLSFLVNQGENDSYMAHGLEWAAYAEADNLEELSAKLLDEVRSHFAADERPEVILRLWDGSTLALSA